MVRLRRRVLTGVVTTRSNSDAPAAANTAVTAVARRHQHNRRVSRNTCCGRQKTGGAGAPTTSHIALVPVGVDNDWDEDARDYRVAACAGVCRAGAIGRLYCCGFRRSRREPLPPRGKRVPSGGKAVPRRGKTAPSRGPTGTRSAPNGRSQGADSARRAYKTAEYGWCAASR